MKVDFTDNSKEVLAEFESAVLRALETCGLTAEGYAKKLQVPDTGLLRNSITHAIGGEAAAIETYEADRPKPGRKSSGCTGYCGLHPHTPPQTDGRCPDFSRSTGIYYTERTSPPARSFDRLSTLQSIA